MDSSQMNIEQNIKLNSGTDNYLTNDTNIVNDHYNPSVRLLQISKTNSNGSCGFHLSRSKWDPYPWVSAVDENTPAELTGLKVGDCVLEVNGEDILGLRISEIAQLVKNRNDSVTLLLWSAGKDPSCDSESLCCGPMPLNLERLTASVQTILSSLECPVCMDAIPPPVLQCQNGHILCLKCRARSERCPICRQRYSCVRSLVAEQIYSSILTSFKIQDDIIKTNDNGTSNSTKLREKLFGAKYKKKPNNIDFKSNCGNGVVGLQTPTNKFLAKILGKAYSLDSLSQNEFIKKKNSSLVIEDNIGKGKNFSLSTNDLPTTDLKQDNQIIHNNIAIPRCPSVNRIITDDVVGINNILGNNLTLNGIKLNKRPSSLNSSAECFNDLMVSSTIKISVPINNCAKNSKESNNIIFLCPLGCTSKLDESSIENHVKIIHKTPILSFSVPSTDISLPIKIPIKNAAIILSLDNKQFWVQTKIDSLGNILICALMQENEHESCKFMLETHLKNNIENKLFEKELITRSSVGSMLKNSWIFNENNKINDNKNNSINQNNIEDFGIIYNDDNVKTIFEENTELILKIVIKHRNS